MTSQDPNPTAVSPQPFADPAPADGLPASHAAVGAWIDRWYRIGLVDRATATRLADDVQTVAGTAAGAPSPPAPGGTPSTADRFLEAARTAVVEALGYLGAAVSVGAVFVLLDVGDWSDVAHLVLLAVVAVVAGLGTFRLTPAATGTTRRLAAVTAATSVLATGGFLALLLDPHCATWDGADLPRCSYAQEYLLPLAFALPTLALAVVMYRRHGHLLTHMAVGGATVLTAVVLGDLLAGPSSDWSTSESLTGLLLFVIGLGWVWGSETKRLEPAWFGTFAAGAMTFGALVAVTNWNPFDGSDDVTVLATLALAAAYLIAGVVTARIRLTIVGALGLLVTVPATLTEVLGLSGTTTATVLLPVGIALTAWAVVAGRRGVRQR